jgi:hypothetical protein
MDWEQIENKWAAMTRRVRADWVADRADIISLPARRGTRLDVQPAVLTERPTDMVGDPRVKMSIE